MLGGPNVSSLWKAQAKAWHLCENRKLLFCECHFKDKTLAQIVSSPMSVGNPNKCATLHQNVATNFDAQNHICGGTKIKLRWFGTKTSQWHKQCTRFSTKCTVSESVFTKLAEFWSSEWCFPVEFSWQLNLSTVTQSKCKWNCVLNLWCIHFHCEHFQRCSHFQTSVKLCHCHVSQNSTKIWNELVLEFWSFSFVKCTVAFWKSVFQVIHQLVHELSSFKLIKTFTICHTNSKHHKNICLSVLCLLSCRILLGWTVRPKVEHLFRFHVVSLNKPIKSMNGSRQRRCSFLLLLRGNWPFLLLTSAKKTSYWSILEGAKKDT